MAGKWLSGKGVREGSVGASIDYSVETKKTMAKRLVKDGLELKKFDPQPRTERPNVMGSRN